MSWGKERIAQLQLPNPEDDDPHPRLLLEGDGVHAGQGFTALFPDGWHDITLEVSWEPTGPGCWYSVTPPSSRLPSGCGGIIRFLMRTLAKVPRTITSWLPRRAP